VYVCSEIGDDRSKHCFLDPATKSAASGRKMTCHLDPTDPSVVDLARFSGSQRRQGRELTLAPSFAAPRTAISDILRLWIRSSDEQIWQIAARTMLGEERWKDRRRLWAKKVDGEKRLRGKEKEERRVDVRREKGGMVAVGSLARFRRGS
jgi:hypothetical protein